MTTFQMRCALPILLASLVACEGTAERKAREEAAINAGTAIATHVPGSIAARAAEREAAATAPSPDALPSTHSTPLAPRPSREDGAAAAARLECGANIPGEDCARIRSSLVRDVDVILDER